MYLHRSAALMEMCNVIFFVRLVNYFLFSSHELVYICVMQFVRQENFHTLRVALECWKGPESKNLF